MEVLRSTKINSDIDNIFIICNNKVRELLPKGMASQFYRTTAQLLFLYMRACPDIQTLVLLLNTRVKKPDVDDWGKLSHGLIYLKCMRHMKRYLSANSLTSMYW